MASYYCWASLMIPDYANAIIAGMIRKGYEVSAGASNDAILHSRNNGASHLFLVRVSLRKNDKTTAKKVGGDFSNVLDDVKAKHYCFMVAESSDAFYGVSNIILPEEVVSPTQPAME
jgi:hypothetical protein